MRYEGVFTGSRYFEMSDLPQNLPLSPDGEKCVLILSRNPDTRLLYRTLLKMWHFRVSESENLRSALSAAAGRQPDVILLDSIMPFSENLETIRKLRESDGLAVTPIVMISGFAQPQYRSLAISGGADDYLVKPVDFETLEDSLKAIFKKSGREINQ